MPWGYAAAAVVGGAASSYGARSAADAQEDATKDSIAEQRRSKEEALRYFSPYADVGGLGLDQVGFLTDPNEQYQWLQNNPMFQMSLDNANDATAKMSAANGRLSAGDTLMQLQQNGLLTSQSLINDQKNSINNLLNFGYGTSAGQANAALGVGNNISNMMMQQGNAQAAGIMGQTNAFNNTLNGLMGAYSMYQNQPSPNGGI